MLQLSLVYMTYVELSTEYILQKVIFSSTLILSAETKLILKQLLWILTLFPAWKSSSGQKSFNEQGKTWKDSFCMNPFSSGSTHANVADKKF